MVRCSAAALLLLLSLLGSAPVGAESVIETSTGPVADLASLRLPPDTTPKGNEPDDGTWFIPLFKVDTRTNAQASSTFFSIRNESDVMTNVLVEYHGTILPSLQHSETLFMNADRLVAVNVRNVPNLDASPNGFARGIIRITPGAPVSVDVFQVDEANRFANGGVAFTVGDFCDFWQVRFLDFGGASGSVMTALVNGPRGFNPANPPTISGTVFNQQGQPINNFNIRTNQWALEVPLLDLVEDDDTRFGSIELVLNATGNPGGVVSVTHSAFGRFSIGSEGVCKDRV